MIGKKFNIRPGGGTWITCYIWDSPEDMHKYAANKLGVEIESEQNTQASYMHQDMMFYRNGDLKSRRLGELHFAKEHLGAGMFAHELQHFISHWVAEMGWGRKLMGKYCEPISDIAQTLTKQFWNNFCEK